MNLINALREIHRKDKEGVDTMDALVLMLLDSAPGLNEVLNVLEAVKAYRESGYSFSELAERYADMYNKKWCAFCDAEGVDGKPLSHKDDCPAARLDAAFTELSRPTRRKE